MYDKLLIISIARSGSTFAYNTFMNRDTRIETSMDHQMLTNEPFDKSDYNTIYKYTDCSTNIISKVHVRHIKEYSLNNYINLFDTKLVMLRKSLFEASLSLAVSIKKEQWGVVRPMNNSVVDIDLEELSTNIQIVWQDMRYILSMQQQWDVQHILWLEDYDTDAKLWNTVTDTHSTSTELFKTHISPNKQNTVSNYTECWEHYLKIENMLSPIRNVSLHNGIVTYEN